MQEEKDNNKYSADYIRKYLDGQLSDQAMQALEKAALEDPFLADAMDGIEESRKHAVSFETGIADLKTKLTERINQRKRKTGILFQLSKWQMAASFIVVIGLAVVTVTYINKKPGISQTTPRPDSSTATFNKPPQENMHRDDSIKPEEHTIASVRPPRTSKTSVNRKEKALSQKTYEPASGQNAGEPSATVASDVVADSLRETEKSEVLAKKDITAPLAMASKKEIRDNGYSKMAIKPIGGPSGNDVIGWDAFYSYIDSNKKINTADSLLKGEEVISFLLHPDGKLSSFKIEKSISRAHDAEILRLIQMAPVLKSREKKKQRCQLQIQFK